MNKLILEKLLHTYKTFDTKHTKDPNAVFKKSWVMPDHIEPDTLGLEVMHSWYKMLTRSIQLSQKFYVDVKEDHLTEEEADKISNEVIFCLPYEMCFMQVDAGDIVINMVVCDMLWDATEKEIAEANPKLQGQYSVSSIPYIKSEDAFVFDPNLYLMEFYTDSTFKYELNEDEDSNPFAYCTDFSSDSEGMYTNRSMQRWASSISTCLVTFMLMMHFPQITATKQVQGVKPQVLESRSRYKASDLRAKPTWEHKTLKLDLYGGESGTGCSNGNRSEGTRFHSVRKHLRKLKNGKHTFVKAHFRGSKDVGVVQKDYEVKL